ncbi:MAG: hypothetical protein ABR968_12810 [Bacteroidales bacterium]|jgi:hypothetical protein
MKKVILLLVLGLAITFVNAQDTTKKKSTTAKPATSPNNVKRTPVKPADLLKEITDDLAANYKEYKILGNATKIVKGDVTTYEVIIQKGTDVKSKEKLIYDADGKFLEKKAPPVKPQTAPKAATGTTTTPDTTKKK